MILYVLFPGSGGMSWFVISQHATLFETLKPACHIRGINLDEHVFTDSNNNILNITMKSVDIPNQTVLISTS